MLGAWPGAGPGVVPGAGWSFPTAIKHLPCFYPMLETKHFSPNLQWFEVGAISLVTVASATPTWPPTLTQHYGLTIHL